MDKLAHLKAALIGDAGQVLWDSDPKDTNTMDKLSALLRSRFSGSRQAHKYRVELRLRRRHSGETLSALHQDIRRLIVPAHPTFASEARDVMARDYFVDALDDHDLALIVRERAPKSLDDALRVALRPEAWAKDARRKNSEIECIMKPRARGAGISSDSRAGSSRLEDRIASVVEKGLSSEAQSKHGHRWSSNKLRKKQNPKLRIVKATFPEHVGMVLRGVRDSKGKEIR